MTGGSVLSQMILQGRYQPGASLLHRMGASTKILGALMLFLLAAWGDLWVLCGLMAVGLLGMGLARIPLQTIGSLVVAFRWLFLIIALIPMVTTPGASIEALAFLPFQVSWLGLWAGLESFLKLLVMFFLSMILVRTTSPQALMDTLQKRERHTRFFWVFFLGLIISSVGITMLVSIEEPSTKMIFFWVLNLMTGVGLLLVGVLGLVYRWKDSRTLSQKNRK